MGITGPENKFTLVPVQIRLANIARNARINNQDMDEVYRLADRERARVDVVVQAHQSSSSLTPEEVKKRDELGTNHRGLYTFPFKR